MPLQYPPNSRRGNALLCAALSAATIHFSMWPAYAQVAKNSDACPASWHPYVELVAIAEKAMAEPPMILFTDDSGQVYDCLGKGVSQKTLDKLSVVSRDIARIIHETKPSDPGGFAVNQCTTSDSTIFQDFTYISIDLPLDQAILDKPMCRTRIEKNLGRLVSKP